LVPASVGRAETLILLAVGTVKTWQTRAVEADVRSVGLGARAIVETRTEGIAERVRYAAVASDGVRIRTSSRDEVVGWILIGTLSDKMEQVVRMRRGMLTCR
jgi:hypothetical protein